MAECRGNLMARKWHWHTGGISQLIAFPAFTHSAYPASMQSSTAKASVPPVRLLLLLLLTFLPVTLTPYLARLLQISFVTGAPRSFLLYAISNWIVLPVVIYVGGWHTLTRIGMSFQVDSKRVLAAIVGFVIGVCIYMIVDFALSSMRAPRVGGMNFVPPGAIEVAVIFASAVLTAAICEEVFFRVVWIGGLTPWIGVRVAAALSIVAFAAIHLPYFGVGGVVFIALWSLVPVLLFVRFGDLSSPLLMHLMNNAWAYIGVPLLIR